MYDPDGMEGYGDNVVPPPTFLRILIHLGLRPQLSSTQFFELFRGMLSGWTLIRLSPTHERRIKTSRSGRRGVVEIPLEICGVLKAVEGLEATALVSRLGTEGQRGRICSSGRDLLSWLLVPGPDRSSTLTCREMRVVQLAFYRANVCEKTSWCLFPWHIPRKSSGYITGLDLDASKRPTRIPASSAMLALQACAALVLPPCVLAILLVASCALGGRFLDAQGLYVPGLFRVPGDTEKIRELKARFDSGEHVEFDEKVSERDRSSEADLSWGICHALLHEQFTMAISPLGAPLTRALHHLSASERSTTCMRLRLYSKCSSGSFQIQSSRLRTMWLC